MAANTKTTAATLATAWTTDKGFEATTEDLMEAFDISPVLAAEVQGEINTLKAAEQASIDRFKI